MTPTIAELVYSIIDDHRDEARMRYVARGGKRPRTRERASRPDTSNSLLRTEPITTRLTIDVVSGDALPVAWASVEASYSYPSGAEASYCTRADPDGRAIVVATHDERPTQLAIRTEGGREDFFGVSPEMSIVIEV